MSQPSPFPRSPSVSPAWAASALLTRLWPSGSLSSCCLGYLPPLPRLGEHCLGGSPFFSMQPSPSPKCRGASDLPSSCATLTDVTLPLDISGCLTCALDSQLPTKTGVILYHHSAESQARPKLSKALRSSRRATSGSTSGWGGDTASSLRPWLPHCPLPQPAASCPSPAHLRLLHPGLHARPLASRALSWALKAALLVPVPRRFPGTCSWGTQRLSPAPLPSNTSVCLFIAHLAP